MVEVFQVSEYLYFRRANLPVRGQCNGAFIVSDTGVFVVDAPPEGIETVEEAEQLFHKPVVGVILTHGHTDHADGLAPFLDRDLTVYCNYRLLSYLVPQDRKIKAHFVGVNGRLDMCLSGGIGVELFILNDVSHSKGDMFIRIPALDLICTGDCVVEYQTAYFHGADTHSWIQCLRRLADEKGSYILAGHGPELFPYSYITDFADHLTVVEKCAKICLDRFHQDLPVKTPPERFASITTTETRELVDRFFAERNDDVLGLEKRAGPEDAKREVRMVLWESLRTRIV
jgi:glyoxylase-like metal-dependent hydrolase (beta-lactamase superfamily II)